MNTMKSLVFLIVTTAALGSAKHTSYDFSALPPEIDLGNFTVPIASFEGSIHLEDITIRGLDTLNLNITHGLILPSGVVVSIPSLYASMNHDSNLYSALGQVKLYTSGIARFELENVKIVVTLDLSDWTYLEFEELGVYFDNIKLDVTGIQLNDEDVTQKLVQEFGSFLNTEIKANLKTFSRHLTNSVNEWLHH